MYKIKIKKDDDFLVKNYYLDEKFLFCEVISKKKLGIEFHEIEENEDEISADSVEKLKEIDEEIIYNKFLHKNFEGVFSNFEEFAKQFILIENLCHHEMIDFIDLEEYGKTLLDQFDFFIIGDDFFIFSK